MPRRAKLAKISHGLASHVYRYFLNNGTTPTLSPVVKIEKKRQRSQGKGIPKTALPKTLALRRNAKQKITALLCMESASYCDMESRAKGDEEIQPQRG